MLDSLIQHVPSWFVQLAVVLAIARVSLFTLSLLRSFYAHFIRPTRNLKKYGSWAIVTGCTDGIGKSFAEQFAKKGLNVVLISRNPDRLNEQAKEIETKFKVQTRVVAVDFSSENPALLEPVKAAIKDLDIGILVNNVGASYDHAQFFNELEAPFIARLIRINVNGTTMMTHLVLPSMIAKKKGAIINVSSASSLVSEPLYAVYSGTKAYINNFTKALYYEYKSKGIDVQCCVPAFVVSKLSKLRKSSLFIPTPDAFVRSAINKIGYDNFTLPFWTHALQFWGIGLLPESMIGNNLLSRGLDIRKRALRKKEETKAQ